MSETEVVGQVDAPDALERIDQGEWRVQPATNQQPHQMSPAERDEFRKHAQGHWYPEGLDLGVPTRRWWRLLLFRG